VAGEGEPALGTSTLTRPKTSCSGFDVVADWLAGRPAEFLRRHLADTMLLGRSLA
jgi:hypothetical protein